MFGKIDVTEALIGGLFTLASLTTTGVYTGGQLQPGSLSLGDSLTSVAGTEITIAFVLSVGALAATYVTNRADGRRGQNAMSVDTDLNKIFYGAASYETYVVGATLIIVLFSGLNILGANGIIQDYWALGWVVTGVQIGGYYVVSYLG